MMSKIGAYCRISYDRNGEALGVERQLKDLTRLAEQRGWTIAKVYTDNDVSAYKKSVTRPAFEEMFADLKSKEIDGIVAWDLDRLWRQPRDLERIIDLYEGEPRPFATIQGDVDLSISNGRAMARVMAAFANKSSDDTARRIKRKIQEQAENGQPHWSNRPYGYNLDGSLDAVEAAVVRRMGELFLNRNSYREIAWKLNEGGLRTRAGQLWTVGNIRKFMVQSRFAAIRVHGGVEYPGNWTPIFTVDEWADIQLTVRERKQTFTGTPSNRKYLLTGLLVCECGTHLRGMTKRDGKTKSLPNGRLRPTYQCPTQSDSLRRLDSCAGTCVGSEPLEHLIKEAIIYRLDSEDLASLLASNSDDDAKLRALLTDTERLTRHRSKLVDDYDDGTLTKADFLRLRTKNDAKLAEVSRNIDGVRRSRLKVTINPGETVREAWDSRGDGWRRELIEALIDHIVIKKSSMKPYYVFDNKRTRFDVERVSIDWRV